MCIWSTFYLAMYIALTALDTHSLMLGRITVTIYS